MSRDHRKLKVFHLADALILNVYAETAERWGICSQVRRSAISVAANIVEGSARRGTRAYLHFMNVATGSAAETLYLLDLSTAWDSCDQKSTANWNRSTTSCLEDCRS